VSYAKLEDERAVRVAKPPCGLGKIYQIREEKKIETS
jgi:hypothetical protein